MVGNGHDEAFSRVRFWTITGFAWLFLVALLFRLFDLQVVDGETYLNRSRSNFLQERRIPHTRGLILDQAGAPLVDNRPAKDVYLTLGLMPDSERSLRRLMAHLEMNYAQLKATDKALLAELKKKHPLWVVAKKELATTQCQSLEKYLDKNKMPGIRVDYDLQGRDVCQVMLDPLSFPSRAGVLRRVTDVIGLNGAEAEQAIQKMWRKSRGLGKFKPIPFVMDVSYDVYARLESAISVGDLPGVSAFDGQRRRYIEGDFATHVLGFMNELSPKELKKKKDAGYRMGDQIGRRGIERVYENVLRGTDGKEEVVVDAKGRRLGVSWAQDLLGEDRYREAEPGHSVVLSIDSQMQHRAETAFQGRAGSVVALEVNTGFVLALASFPDYDPNLLNSKERSTLVTSLNTNPDKPWINKAVQEHYAPGSTFKAITAVAGLVNNLTGNYNSRYCPGFYQMGRTKWRCFHRGGHGHIALAEAMQKSCDTYFYSLGHELGIDRLAATSTLLGFGQPTGIDLDGEIPGIIPDKAWYKKHFGRYSPGYVVNNSIGQGDVTVTPLQLASAYAALINGGRVFRPQLVREILNHRGEVVEEKQPELVNQLDSIEQELELVRRSMGYVTQKGGTANGLLYRKDLPDMSLWLRDSGLVLGGKTGTAQVVKLSKAIAHLDPEEVKYEQRDHAWFVGFMPAHKPEVIIVTMTEHGGFGGTTSAPVTAQVAQVWFDEVRGKGRFSNLEPMPKVRSLKELKAEKEENHEYLQ